MFYDCLFSTALQREYQPAPTPLRTERLGQWRGRGHLATAIKAFWGQSSNELQFLGSQGSSQGR